MSFLRKTINLLTDRRDIKRPVVMKDFNERNETLQALESLANTDDPAILKDKVEKDLKLFSIGLEGEKNVFFELKHSLLPIVILHDLNIEYDNYKAQIDFVVITHKYILLLETKKLFGNVKITDKGEFQRVIKRGNRVVKHEGMYSPLNQVERHAEILENFLVSNKIISRCPLRSAVVFANPKTILDISKKAPKSVQSRTIRHDQIKTFIQSELEKESKVFMMDEQVYEIAEFLLKHNKEKSFNEDKYFHNVTESTINHRTSEETSLKISNKELREKLIAYRLKTSKKLGVKPFYIFTNKTMEALLDMRPQTKKELLQVPGIGNKKLEEFGEDLLKVLNE